MPLASFVLFDDRGLSFSIDTRCFNPGLLINTESQKICLDLLKTPGAKPHIMIPHHGSLNCIGGYHD